MPGFLTPKKHLQEDFVLGSEETLLRTVGLESSREASGRCIIPVTYPSPRVSLKFPVRAHAPRGAFSFFVPSPLRSYLGRGFLCLGTELGRLVLASPRGPAGLNHEGGTFAFCHPAARSSCQPKASNKHSEGRNSQARRGRYKKTAQSKARGVFGLAASAPPHAGLRGGNNPGSCLRVKANASSLLAGFVCRHWL